MSSSKPQRTRKLGVVAIAGLVAGLLMVAPATSTPGVQPVDCVTTGSGLLQVFNVDDPNNSGSYVSRFMLLDVESNEYVDAPNFTDLVWADLGLPGRWMNAAAVDHATGQMFGVVRHTGGDQVLVRFDGDGDVEYLGKLANDAAPKAATVTSTGTFVYNNKSATVSTDRGMERILNVSDLVAQADYSAALNVVLGETVSQEGEWVSGGDYASFVDANGDEFVMWHWYSNDRFYGYKVSDIDNGTADGNWYGFDITWPASWGANGGVGASWTVDGDLYFSRNDGGGVFVIKSEDLDGTSDTPGSSPYGTGVVSETQIASTIETDSNDGFGCATPDQAPTATPVQVLPCSTGPVGMMIHEAGGTAGAYTSTFHRINADTNTIDAATDFATINWGSVGDGNWQMGAVASDPVAGMAYGILYQDGESGVLVRFDQDGDYEFVGALEGTSFPAAVVAGDGTLIYSAVERTGSGVVRSVVNVADLEPIEDFATALNTTISAADSWTYNTADGGFPTGNNDYGLVQDENGEEFVAWVEGDLLRIRAVDEINDAATGDSYWEVFDLDLVDNDLDSSWQGLWGDGRNLFLHAGTSPDYQLYVIEDFASAVDGLGNPAVAPSVTLTELASSSTVGDGFGCFTSTQIPEWETPPTTTTTVAPTTTTVAPTTTTTIIVAPPEPETPDPSEPADPTVAPPDFTG